MTPPDDADARTGAAAGDRPTDAPATPPDPAPASPADAEAQAEAETESVADVRATSGKSAALLVAAGIFLSRIIGLVRERAISYFFGLGPHADVLRVAFKTPNFLQNLLGEGTVSAAFIPVYSRMLEEGRPEAAGRFAGAVLGLLVSLVAVCVAVGMLLARPLLAVLQPGWLGDAARVAAGAADVDRFALVVQTVRYTFPMAGVLVLFAWALGVMNSHRRFFLPYVAPVAWNLAIIAGMAWAAVALFGTPTAIGALTVVPVAAADRILFAALAGALVGGVLQFAVLLPGVFREMRGFRLSVSRDVEGVRESFRAFVPVVLGRGAYQISGYLDLFLAGFLAAGAISALTQALTLYVLPVSLFGMSVAASELPELSRLRAAGIEPFFERVRRSLAQILYPIVAATVGYVGFGVLVVGAFFQTGQFGEADSWLVALTLAAFALGLPATTASRLLQNAFYALGDTKTPARLAVWRLAVATVVGAGLMVVLERLSVTDVVGIAARPGEPLRLGAVGLALGASLGAWTELWALVRTLRRQAPTFRMPTGRAFQMLGLAGLASIPAATAQALLPGALPVLVRAAVVLGLFGATYLGLGAALGFSEGDAWTGRLLRRRRRA
ncbi:MAG TPA: murein biosynthesis integral membrane protein MurJ [Rubricoccaceae bacterium]|jgi:putative peptidoglycan lipid II flippase